MPARRGSTEYCGVIISASVSGESTSPLAPAPPCNSHSAYVAMSTNDDSTEPAPRIVMS